MNNIYNFRPVVLLIVLLSALLGQKATAQQIGHQKMQKVVIEKCPGNDVAHLLDTLGFDSTILVNHSAGFAKKVMIELDTGNSEKKIVQILDGDTVVNETIKSVSSPDQKKIEYSSNNKNNMDFGGAFDLANWNDLLPYDADEEEKNHVKESLVETLKDNNVQHMIFIGRDGDNIRIEKEGEMVFINSLEDVKDIDSNVDVTKNEAGERLIVLNTRIVLDDKQEQNQDPIKSEQLLPGNNAPNFEFIKFYPNPSTQTINIHFKVNDARHIAVIITNMLGQLVFEDVRKSFSGEYKQGVDLKKYGTGTYLMQIKQGKRTITRKIIVE